MMIMLNKKYMFLLMLYTSQYIPLGFFFGAIPAILGSQGVGMEVIGSIYMLGLFWVFKFMWAPLIDSKKIPFIKGHYRSWLITVQVLLSISMFIGAFFSIKDAFVLSLVFIALINFLSSTQDICVDGLVVNSLNKEELVYANSTQSVGTFLGSFIGLALPLYSYDIYTWKVTLMILSFLVLIPAIFLFFYKEQDFKKNIQRISFAEVFNFLKIKGAFRILFIMTPSYFILETSFPVIQQLLIKNDWSLMEIVFSQNIISSIFGITAAILAGSIIKKYGKYKSYKFFSILILIDVCMMINMDDYAKNHLIVTTILSFNYFCLGLFMTIYYTYIMSNSSKEFAGTQVNIQHGLLLFLSLIFTKVIFTLVVTFSFKIAFIVLACIFLLSLIFFIRKTDK